MLALGVPRLSARLRPSPGALRRWGTLAWLILRVGRDVVRSAIEVALGVLRLPRRVPRGAFVRVPLELRDTHALAALSIRYVAPGMFGVFLSFGFLIGIVLATGASLVLAQAMQVPYVFSPGVNLLSFLFSAGIGVLFGYFPARRAARMDPIEALRHE